jgi:hypothetical protein
LSARRLLSTGVLAAAAAAGPILGQSTARQTFKFTREAGLALRKLWQESAAAREERVACIGSTIRNDTVWVNRVNPLQSEEADSLGISARASVEQCGPPEWSGTVHTHIALYTDDLPSTKFSAQDRIAMRLWYDRWHADGVFCVVYSEDDAHCEADGVVGGLRSRPRVVR